MVPTNTKFFRLEVVNRAEPTLKGIVEARELVDKWA